MTLRRATTAAFILLALGGCRRYEPALGQRSPSPGLAAIAKPDQPSPSSSSEDAIAEPPEALKIANARAFADTVTALSEPDAAFFSDNFVSNETSYLDVASRLGELAPKGGAYIGVGPEQNFTYIAITRPSVAFIIDIRRQNMLLHRLYKAIFETATSRAHFLALLTSRPCDLSSAPPDTASIASVLAYVDRLPTNDEAFADLHAKLVAGIEMEDGKPLDAADTMALEKAHRAFFASSLDLRFGLKKANGRRCPTLRELLSSKDPDGRELGFLADEDRFRFVQELERNHRIIPVVGDVAGDRAMPGIAAYLSKAGVTVSAFYISNVEQYLFEPGVWAKWSRNVEALPQSDRSLFIRAYLDQGKPHPAQRKGQRTATLLQRMSDFEAHNAKRPYSSFWAVATDDVVR